MLFGARAVDEVSAVLTAEDFFRPAHQTIFRAIRDIPSSGVDLVTLKRRLIELGALDNVGGEEYLIRIAEFVPSPANAKHYAAIVKENAALRRLEAALNRGLALVRDPDLGTAAKLAEAQQLLRQAEHRVSAPPIPLAAVLIEVLQDVEGGAEEGVTTGFRHLDAATICGGYPKGQLVVVSAYQKAGKTTFSLSSTLRLLKAGRSVIYYTLADLTPKQLAKRAIAQETGHSAPPQGNLEEFQRYLDGIDRMYSSGWKLDFLSARDHGLTIEQIVVAIRNAFWAFPRDVVFIDYAQKIESRDARLESATKVLEHASRQLTALAEELDVPIVLGSQITEDRDGRVITKYAKALEEDAGVVYRIHRRTEEEKESNRVEIEVAFNRFGEERKVRLGWDKARVMFDD
jgi:replicative DNA helicase